MMAKRKQSPYFDKKETRSLEERREDQAGELAAMMRLAVRKSPLIRKQVEALGIRPAKRNAYDILKMLPVISREKLVQSEIDNPPYAGLGNPDSVSVELADAIEVTGWPDTIWLTQQERVDEDTAIFGQADYDLTDKLTLTAGLRYFWVDNWLKGFFGYGLGYSDRGPPGAESTDPRGPGSDEDSCVLRQPIGPAGPNFRDAPCLNVDKGVKEDDFSTKLSASYKLTDKTTVALDITHTFYSEIASISNQGPNYPGTPSGPFPSSQAENPGAASRRSIVLVNL